MKYTNIIQDTRKSKFKKYVCLWLIILQSVSIKVCSVFQCKWFAWKDSSPKWPIMSRARRKALLTHSLTHLFSVSNFYWWTWRKHTWEVTYPVLVEGRVRQWIHIREYLEVVPCTFPKSAASLLSPSIQIILKDTHKLTRCLLMPRWIFLYTAITRPKQQMTHMNI